MRGPIDYIIVAFEGNKFNGDILKALDEAEQKQIISVIALSVVTKDKEGNVKMMGVSEFGDNYLIEFSNNHKADDVVTQEDLDEVGDLITEDTTAGLLVVEQLWAKPLKKALIEANGVLIAEGRIHPDAAEELNKEGEQ